MSEEKYYRRNLEKLNVSRLLAVPGRVAQASEFSDIQDILGSQLKSVGDAIMYDGNIVSGCTLIINGDNTVSLSEGKVYLNGFVRDVPETLNIPITGSGTDTICVVLKEEIRQSGQVYTNSAGETVFDGSILLDQSLLENYDQVGCDAIQYSVSVESNVSGAPVLYTLVNGALPTTQTTQNEYSQITEILARRTFDESGNYRIDGLKMMNRYTDNTFTSNEMTDDLEYFNLNLTSGKAYIRGFEVVKPSDSIFKVRRASDVEQIDNESLKDGTDNNSRYKTAYTPVNTDKSKIEVSWGFARKENVSKGQTFNALGVNSGVISTSIRVIVGSTVYSGEGNWQLTDASSHGNSSVITYTTAFNSLVAQGTSITIVYVYSRTLLPEEYTITSQGQFELDKSAYRSGESHQQTAGEQTIIAANYYPSIADYEYFLARRDLVSIDKSGNIIVTEGAPNIVNLCSVPKISDDNLLQLGVVQIDAGSNVPNIINKSVDGVNMEQLNKMLARLVDLEYNDSITDLDNEAASGEPASELKGVFTDGFAGFTKSDLTYKDGFTASIDDENKYLTVGYDYVQVALTPDGIGNYGGCISIPYTKVTGISQSKATRNKLVNPYKVFSPLVPILLKAQRVTRKYNNGTLVSDVVSETGWANKLTVTDTDVHVSVNVGTTNTVYQYVSVGSTRSWFNRYGRNYLQNFFGTSNLNELSKDYGANNSSIYGADAQVSQTTSSTKTVKTKETLKYMVPKKVTVFAQSFAPYADNIKVYFDNKLVQCTPSYTNILNNSSTRGTHQGSDVGTLRADQFGYTEGSFQIPSGTECGIKEVKVVFTGDADNKAKDGVAYYEGQHTNERETTTITYTRRVLRVHDPLAQSFVFEEERFVSGVKIYFQYFDSTCPVQVQIRNMVNGYPGDLVYGETTINSAVASSDASVPTLVEFSKPIRCLADTMYCMVILTDSGTTSLWTAELGDREIGYNDTNDPNKMHYVTGNPYEEGVLFSSSNSLTWTAHQSADLKFSVEVAKFETDQEYIINYGTIQSANITAFAIECDYLLPSACTARWEYSLDNKNWISCEPFEQIELATVVSRVSVRCVVKTSSPWVSPLFSADNSYFTCISNHTNGNYYSRTVKMDQYFDNLKIYVNTFNDSRLSYKVSYRLEDSAEWTQLQMLTTNNVEYDSSNTEEVRYRKDLGNGYVENFWMIPDIEADSMKVKIEMATTDRTCIPRVQKLRCIMKDVK